MSTITLLLIILVALSLNFATFSQANEICENAKSLFYKQLQSPEKNINTGVQYWIELERDKKSYLVSNKFIFKSGDRIRFHIKSNTKAYAYIILKEGSSGEHTILFPDPNHKDHNELKANLDYAIPADGYLSFDKNPGTEKVQLLLSRLPLDPQAYLKSELIKNRIFISYHKEGSKDLIPGSIVLSYASPQSDNTSTSEKPAKEEEVENEQVELNKLKTKQNTELIVNGENNQNFATTIVQKNIKDLLALDVLLLHQP